MVLQAFILALTGLAWLVQASPLVDPSTCDCSPGSYSTPATVLTASGGFSTPMAGMSSAFSYASMASMGPFSSYAASAAIFSSASSAPRSSGLANPNGPFCTPSKTKLTIKGGAWVAMHETTKDTWLFQPANTMDSPSVTIDYSSCDDPLQLNIWTWPTVYDTWANTSDYKQTVNCLISGTPTADETSMLLKYNSPFWQWTGSGDNGLNMTCLNSQPNQPIPSGAQTVGPDPSCPSYNLHTQLNTDFVKLKDWTNDFYLCSNGTGDIDTPRKCTDPYIHFTYWHYASQADLDSQAAPTSTMDCILIGNQTADCTNTLKDSGMDTKCFTQTCTKGGPPPPA